jgi:hypothetical protein
MTVDVNVLEADESFLEEIDEIIEETMVQLFILQPRDQEALESAKAAAQEHTAIFYAAPLGLRHDADENCVGLFVDRPDLLKELEITKPLFVDASQLDGELAALLNATPCKGIVLNATEVHEGLERFLFAIGPDTVDAFGTEKLSAVTMDRIVLQSGYPGYGFEQIHATAKRISDATFRPEQSIIANATRNALMLLGFKK